MRGLGCVGFNNLDIQDEDDRVGKEEDDSQQMRRDQQCVSRGPGITGWRSWTAPVLRDGSIHVEISFLETDREHEANGMRSQRKRLEMTALEK